MMEPMPPGLEYKALAKAAFTFPAIDNHAHPLLTAKHRSILPFEGLISEAEGDALTEHVHTMAFYRATAQLSKVLHLQGEVSWEKLKSAREKIEYNELCRFFLGQTGIQCFLIDDGLGGVTEYAEGYKWHDQFTNSPTKRILRVEVLAEEILAEVCKDAIHPSFETLKENNIFQSFCTKFCDRLRKYGADAEVIGFKSIICYRTGLDISLAREGDQEDIEKAIMAALVASQMKNGRWRIAEKPLNDYVVRITLKIAGQFDKPVQFHTGLGDKDLNLNLATPSLMQPLINAFPQTTFVLLHSSYPFTREAGYLCAVYNNVYVDFGEIFPIVSAHGQREAVKMMLELCPTDKIMWSSDGHWWPESFYLGITQAREALYEVLADSVRRNDLTETLAVSIVERALFHNANRMYKLGLSPQLPPASERVSLVGNKIGEI